MAIAVDIIVLMDSLSSWERWGYLSAAAVTVGCAGEAVHEFTGWFRRYSWWAMHGSKASALLLVAALAVEIPVQLTTNSKSGRIIGLLNIQAAEARIRAAQIERKFAWRVITSDQGDRLVAALAGHSFSIYLEYSTYDSEAYEYANEIYGALSGSSLHVMPYDIVPFQPARGIMVNGPSGADHDALANALTSAGIQFTVGKEPPIGNEGGGVVRMSIGGRFPP